MLFQRYFSLFVFKFLNQDLVCLYLVGESLHKKYSFRLRTTCGNSQACSSPRCGFQIDPALTLHRPLSLPLGISLLSCRWLHNFTTASCCSTPPALDSGSQGACPRSPASWICSFTSQFNHLHQSIVL